MTNFEKVEFYYTSNEKLLKYFEDKLYKDFNIPKDEFFDLPTLFDVLKRENKSTKAFEITDYWIDMGKPSDYQEIDKKMRDC